MKPVKLASQVFAGLVSLIGLVALAGWLFEIPLLKAGVVGAVSMNPATAVAFMFSAVSLWLLNTPGSSQARIGRLAGALVAMIGIIKLTDYALGIE